jgi:hypothetical protein
LSFDKKYRNFKLFKFTAKSLKKVGIVVDANPERMVKEQNLKDKVREKRVEIEEKRNM